MIRCWIFLYVFGFPPLAQALPIGFGIHQGAFEYQEVQTPNFWIYHDARTPHEAAMVAHSLEAVRPLVEGWMGVQRSRRLPVITSAETANASFANFITDTIELQTWGQGDRSTFQHEYVHITMYLHLHNWFGPAGSVIHLPWMPAWFLEGLAEALSISVRSDIQAGIERYAALTGRWPSYDRLHSLYTDDYFSEEGYAISGAFVRWILQQGQEALFPALMQDFFRYSTPAYYVFSCNPFSAFMPMDAALQGYVGLSKEALAKEAGRKLYAAYQQAAAAHWHQYAKGTLVTESLKINVLPTATVTAAPLPDSILYTTPLRAGVGFAVAKRLDLHSGMERHRVVRLREGVIEALQIGEAQRILGLYETPRGLIFEKQNYEETSLCEVDLSGATPSIACPVVHILPKTVHIVGGIKDAEGKYTRLWFRVNEQTLGGDRVALQEWDLASPVASLSPIAWGMELPLSVAQSDASYWIVGAEHNRRFLRKQSKEGVCHGQLELEDLLQRLSVTQQGKLRLEIQERGLWKVVEVMPSVLSLGSCRQGMAPTSPLAWGVQQPVQYPIPSLHDALAAGSIWLEDSDSEYGAIRMQQAVYIKNAVPLDQDAPSAPFPSITASQPTQWRGRPILGFPWIGGDDALGYQYGVLSVPLMDHLQNETVQLSFLYGPNSHYPNTDISLVSTRFWPSLTLSAYRAQIWDGFLLDSTSQKIATSYLDEKGLRGEALLPFYFLQQEWDLHIGVRMGDRHTYLGPHNPRTGLLTAPFTSLNHMQKYGRLTLQESIGGEWAGGALNRNFDFNRVEGSLSLGYVLPWRESKVGVGLQGSRIRSKDGKTTNLKEFYVPLKTFIPGSGGGYNQNSWALLGKGSLFFNSYGDSQLRGKLDFSTPVVKNIDYFLWILYVERLDFSAFYNYGGAWFQNQNWREHLLRAHGYTADLLFQNKGVRFNTSLGVGQVIGDFWQLYASAGFDALF